MELQVLDPFGDYETAGYLRNSVRAQYRWRGDESEGDETLEARPTTDLHGEHGFNPCSPCESVVALHPFLEGNGRTILTVFADLTRRAGFYVEWEAIQKDEFLRTLTEELLQPGKAIMDALVLRYVREGVLSVGKTASGLRVNFKRDRN